MKKLISSVILVLLIGTASFNIKSFAEMNAPELPCLNEQDIAHDYAMFSRNCPLSPVLYKRCEPEHPYEYCCISEQTVCPSD